MWPFGDSTTAERGSTRVYASLLAGQLQQRGGAAVRVVNAGVGGNTTPVARKRLEKDVLAHQPALVMIQFGINDAAVDVWKTPPVTVPRTDLKTFEADLRFSVAECRRTGAIVLLLTPNPLQWADVTRKLYGKILVGPAAETRLGFDFPDPSGEGLNQRPIAGGHAVLGRFIQGIDFPGIRTSRCRHYCR